MGQGSQPLGRAGGEQRRWHMGRQLGHFARMEEHVRFTTVAKDAAS